MKGFSSLMVEAIIVLLAVSVVGMLYNIYNQKTDFMMSLKDCENKCYEGYIPYSKEELENLNFTVIGEGNYGEIYLNKEENQFIVRLR